MPENNNEQINDKNYEFLEKKSNKYFGYENDNGESVRGLISSAGETPESYIDKDRLNSLLQAYVIIKFSSDEARIRLNSLLPVYDTIKSRLNDSSLSKEEKEMLEQIEKLKQRAYSTKPMELAMSLEQRFGFILYQTIANEFSQGKLEFKPEMEDSNIRVMWEDNIEMIKSNIANLPSRVSPSEIADGNLYDMVFPRLIGPRLPEHDDDDGYDYPINEFDKIVNDYDNPPQAWTKK